MQATPIKLPGADGLTLAAYEWSREGVPLVFLHGYGNDAHVWDEVCPNGAPEPWEAEALFSDGDLEREVESHRRYPRTVEPEAEVEELRAIWKDRRLTVGSEDPNISGRDVAEAAARAYGLPGWD